MNKPALKNPFFYILIRSWNSYNFLKKSLESVFSQTYKNFKILYIDDASDYTKPQIQYLKNSLKNHVYVFNKDRKYSVYNACYMLRNFSLKKNSVILILDGDDWLINKNALNYLSSVYSNNTNLFLTYGSCLIWDGQKLVSNSSDKYHSYLNTPYPNKTIKQLSFRKEPFRISHPMTFAMFLFDRIKQSDFREENGDWLKYCFDLSAFLPLLEMTGGKHKFIRKTLSVYNVSGPQLNIKINPYEFVREDLLIRKKKPYGKFI